MLTPERFRILYPQFSEVSDDNITRYIGEFRILAGTWTRESVIIEEALSEICEGLYTAHMLTTDLSFPLTKDNIEQGLSRGKYVSREHTPDFTVDYAAYNSAEDFKNSTETNTKERELNLMYLKKVTEKYYEYFDIPVEIPRVIGSFCEQFKLTMYGQRLLYNLSLIENFLMETLKNKLETEISEKIKEMRGNTPLALVV
jgi:hypothetical protein